MKKFFNILYYLIFTAIIVIVLWQLGQNFLKESNMKKRKVEHNITKKVAKNKTKAQEPELSKIDRYLLELYKKLKEKKPKKLTKEQKEILKAKKTPLAKRLKELKAKYGNRIFIRIFKKENELEVWIQPKNSKTFKLLKVYDICYYSGKLGPKLKEGDRQAPEGFYKVYKSSLNPHSHYHLSFNLGYPNSYDKSLGRTGSYLMVHGKCVSVGCYAMGDKNIEEIYKLVKSALYKNQPFVQVHIFPFRMSKINLAKYKSNRWHKFWLNLKTGYDIFQKNHIPPRVEVQEKQYVFKSVL